MDLVFALYIIILMFYFLRGTQSMNIKVTEGGPLPFAFDIISHCFAYGQKVFIKHPKDILDFFKQSFPEGYTWERESTFEDGGILTIKQKTRY
jgi:hypothetical protein